jgi:hypothetical protein
MTARMMAQDVLIAACQQKRVVAAARELDEKARRTVRDVLARTGKQDALNFWASVCELADGEAS